MNRSMLRRRKLLIALGLLFAALVVVAAFEPFRIVPGLLSGDAFYWLRPTRYWREILRADGENRAISANTRNRFYSDNFECEPVLRECLRDPDPNVRWSAVGLLERSQPIRNEMPALVAALDDPELNVRLRVLRAFEINGRDAAAAIPRLIELLNDPDDQLAHFADRALWKIDSRQAAEACKWKTCTNEKWRFSVLIPAEPKEGTAVAAGPSGFVPVHTWITMQRATAYSVAVTDYSEEQLKGFPPAIWFQRLREQTGPMGLHVVRDRDIEQNGLSGWEHLSEADNDGRVLARLFWVGRRLYQATVTFKPEFVSPGAAEYFLDSFRIEKNDQPRMP